MYKKIKELFLNHIEIFIFTILNLCFYGNFMIKHYAPDTYFTEALGWDVTAGQYWQNGRWLMTAFSKFCGIFHIGYTLEQLMSWGIAIISVTLAATMMYSILYEYVGENCSIKKRIWIILISFMMISNVFLLEDFIFAEYTGMICLGILFDTLAARYVLKAINKKKVSYYLLGILFGILGMNGHQGNFGILVVISVLCSPTLWKNLKSFLINNLVIGSAYVIPALVNVVETRIGGAGRAANGKIDLVASFEKATEGIKQLFVTTANYMPYGLYVSFLCVAGMYLLYVIIKEKSLFTILQTAYYSVIISLGIYAPLMVTDVSFIDVVPRTVYIMGGLIPVIMTVLLLHLDISLENSVVLPVLIVAFLFVQYRGVLNITIDHYKANLLDRYEAQFIGEKLWFYEEEHGTKVTKMALYWDENVTGLAPDISGYGAVNERVMTNDWAAPLALQCLDGHVLQQTEPSQEVYDQYFKGKDWLHMEEEQMIIIGDTLHLCAY